MKRYIKADVFDISEEDDLTRARYAKAKDASPRLLARLASDPNEQIRGIVAMHRNTPDEVRWQLAHDKYPGVRCDIFDCKERLPEKYFELLSEDPNSDVRDCVASRLDAPVSVLKRLLQDSDKAVREMAEYTLRERGEV